MQEGGESRTSSLERGIAHRIADMVDVRIASGEDVDTLVKSGDCEPGLNHELENSTGWMWFQV